MSSFEEASSYVEESPAYWEIDEETTIEELDGMFQGMDEGIALKASGSKGNSGVQVQGETLPSNTYENYGESEILVGDDFRYELDRALERSGIDKIE